MNTPVTLSTLKNLGLTSYEAKIYLTLLERNTLTVPEISRLAQVPRPSAYEALDKLMSKGMCISKPGHTKKYSASDPTVLQERFFVEAGKSMEAELQQLENSFKEKQKEILEKNSSLKQNIGKVIEELRPQYENSREATGPLDYIGIIKDPYQIHKRFMQLADQAKEEMLGFTKPPYTVSKEKLTEQTEQQAQLLRRGLKIRVIYEIPQDKEEFEWWFNDIDANVKYGEEARVMKELPMKMSIFDSRIVIFALEDPVSKQPSLTAQVIEHRALAKGLKALFQTFWDRAEDYHILRD